MSQSWLDRSLLNTLHQASRPAGVDIELGPSSGSLPSSFSRGPIIRLKDRKALLSLWLNPDMNFGDLYSEGRIEIEGDLPGLLEALYAVPERRMAGLFSRWLGFIQGNTLRAARKNIHRHYDISTDFYRLWLDPQMVYTCAYFPHEHSTLEEAQTAKLDLVCRKLWLKPGETVVEAGCGWGSLALHMARHYGVKVKAFNISHEQIEFARARARREGLASRVEFLEEDYRNISGSYDAFVSVGMLEHVGKKYYPEFARAIHRSIGSSGRGLVHFIGRNQSRPLSPWIRKRIFPGAYVPTLREAVQALEPYDFGLLDVENLRPHYARTLECWLDAYERSYSVVAERFGHRFARMWRFYLAGSIAAFRTGGLQLFQVVLAGRKCRSAPLTREHLYHSSEPARRRDVEWISATS